MIRHFRELYQYRGLLLSLVQRELKARYRGSVLGFFWTFLNPMLHMLVYWLLFDVMSKNQVASTTRSSCSWGCCRGSGSPPR